ncbi:MAG: universal stress protein UspA [Crocinitomicaceae bacterium]|nr:universal stress protein UspA [Crocinitomicaceae bacterium]|tara:strand:+ start:1695 stop:2525 length:831 start_codon:yes stop_codon:yes gene_type:complete
MKKILVPTDFSDCAQAAENIALEIAIKANAEIHFMHILDTPVNWIKLPLEKEKLFPETKHLIALTKTKLSELKNKAQKLGLKAETFLTFNESREGIDTHIKHHEHDFVVMGSHGISGLKSIIGSNTQKVVRYSPAPVLVIKEKQPFEIKNIVFASTFEEDVHKPFHKIIEFADLMKAQIHLLNVNVPFRFKETGEAEANMKAFLETCSRGTYSINIYNALNERRGIQKFSESINADVIALTTHGKTGFMKMLSPSIAEGLVNHSSFPILSVTIFSE